MKIEAADLFCGIGGLTYGLKSAKISVVAGLDNDTSCKTVYEKNSGAKFIAADIAKYDFSEMKRFFSAESRKVLVGCAPCQPFSSHSFKDKKRSQDDRWNLLTHFIRAVDELTPDVVSMENVRGLTKTDVFEDFIKALTERGYYIDHKVVYCPDYGIPQGRHRLVLLASRLGPIQIPKPTHKSDSYVTVKQAIEDLPSIRAGETLPQDPVHRAMGLTPINLKRIKKSKPNGSWRDWDKRLRPACFKKKSGKSYTPVYGRMSWDDVSPTITTQFFNYGSGRFGHPKQDRALSLREGALLQTFPIDYHFDDSLPTSLVGRHIGNAVPPKLGEVIGRAIRGHVRTYGK